MGLKKAIRCLALRALRNGMGLLLTVLLLGGLRVAPAQALECSVCIDCHGALAEIHGDFNHAAAPGSGPVLIFADFEHDDAGWTNGTPHFDVTVTCTICHNTDLPAVHGNDCATCHPTPYDTIKTETWNKGCQQGGCHTSYHDESTIAHLAWENAYNSSGNDCAICHIQSSWAVTEEQCKNCHAAFAPGDVSPPTTSTDALATYVGPAKIGFSISDNGKVGVGRTFYQLDGGAVTAAGKHLFVGNDAAGQHELKFWSKDQSGNTELTQNTVYFSVVEDAAPPTTNSDAQASYSQGAVITLTATDASTLGVKNTYYSINGGAPQTGTRVEIPAASGTLSYTLTFWSEDWAGNVEAQHSVSFTVTSGNGILRLVWGDSDVNGSPCAGDPEAWADWTVYRGGFSGPVVATGSGSCPNWDGVDDVSVPVGYTYSVRVNWWDSYYGYDDQTDFPNNAVTTPGQVIRLSY